MFLHLRPHHYFKKDRHFYICSFGGCGSWIIAQYLSNFGIVHHIHSRAPPTPHVTTVVDEHFTSVVSPFTSNIVLYVYRDPVAALLSVRRRFDLRNHFSNIECPDPSVTLEDVAEQQEDLLGLTDFHRNYTTPSALRKYPIYCVQYEHFFNRLPEFNQALGLINYPKLYPSKKENNNVAEGGLLTDLKTVYAPLAQEMRLRPFITIT